MFNRTALAVAALLTGFAARGEAAPKRSAEFKQLPLAFEENRGQASSDVKYLVRRGRYALYVDGQGVRLAAPHHSPVRLRFAGARADAVAEGLERQPGTSNYFVGNDPGQWKTGIPQYGRVKLRGVYAGIDLVYYGHEGELEYDLVVAPGHDPRQVRLRVEGADSLAIDTGGDLLIRTSAGSIRQRRPVVYQERRDGRKTVTARYVLRKDGEVALSLGGYDRRSNLVIDPSVVFTTYFGGTESSRKLDYSNAVATDGDGNVYIAGWTDATDYPGLTYPGDSLAAFVAKLNATGNSILWATYISGHSGADSYATAIAVDSQQRVYVTGATQSPTFPTVNAPYPNLRGSINAWVARLNVDGSLNYSTYLGGSFSDYASDLGIDAAGSAYVAGTTNSPDLPVTTGAAQAKYAGGNDGFLFKMSPDGGQVVYCTYLGGGSDDAAAGLAVDGAGYGYVALQSTSGELPIQGGFQTQIAGGSAGYITTTRGGSWSNLNNGPIEASVNYWLIPGADQGSLYAATQGQGIFKSSDRGTTWQAMNTGLKDLNVRVMAADPTNGSALFAGTASSLYRSTDGGQSWTELSVDSGPFDVMAIAVSPANHNNVYVSFRRTTAATGQLGIGDVCGGFYRSADGGQTWSVQAGDVGAGVALTHMCVTNFIVSPTDPQGAWAVFNADDSQFSISGLYQFQTSNGFWGQITSVAGLYLAIADPNNVKTVYGLSNQYGIVKTTDQGAHWSQVNTGLPNDGSTYDAFYTLAMSPGNSSTLYVGTGANGVYTTSNGGSNWSSIRGNLPAIPMASLAVDPGNGSNVFAGAIYLADAYVAELNPEGTAVLYSTYLGGSLTDTPFYVSVDPSGNIYVEGETPSPDLKTTAAAYQRSLSGSSDVFVAQITPGGQLGYLTYLGGSADESSGGVRADGFGTLYLAGSTTSANFPLMKATQSSRRGTSDAFVSRLDLTSGTLLFSTYLGGTGTDGVYGLAADSSGNVAVAGYTQSTDLPTSSPAQSKLKGAIDSLVAKYSDPETILVVGGAPLNLTATAGSGPLYAALPVGSSGQSLQFTAVVSATPWLTLTPASGTTPAVLLMQIDTNQLSPGANQGTIQLSASGVSVSPVTVTVNVTAIAAQGPTIASVDTASGGPLIAPNTYIEIKGANLATTGPRIWTGPDFVNNQLPLIMDGVSVTINGKKAYIYYISSSQINVLTTPDLVEGPVVIQVSNSLGTSAPFTAQMRRKSPAFLLSDLRQVAARHLNGDQIGAPGSIPGVKLTPAKPGETVVLFGNGWGQTTTPVVPGALTQSGPLPVIPVIKIGGVQADVQFAGLSAVGEFQFNVVVPASVQDGDNALAAELDGKVVQVVYITIQH